MMRLKINNNRHAELVSASYFLRQRGRSKTLKQVQGDNEYEGMLN
jgi:predicted HD phosphohydrolase